MLSHKSTKPLLLTKGRNQKSKRNITWIPLTWSLELSTSIHFPARAQAPSTQFLLTRSGICLKSSPTKKQERQHIWGIWGWFMLIHIDSQTCVFCYLKNVLDIEIQKTIVSGLEATFFLGEISTSLTREACFKKEPWLTLEIKLMEIYSNYALIAFASTYILFCWNGTHQTMIFKRCLAAKLANMTAEVYHGRIISAHKCGKQNLCFTSFIWLWRWSASCQSPVLSPEYFLNPQHVSDLLRFQL